MRVEASTWRMACSALQQASFYSFNPDLVESAYAIAMADLCSVFCG